MKRDHAPQPVKASTGWRCVACGEPVVEATRASASYWRHNTKGPEIVYGRRLRECSE